LQVRDVSGHYSIPLGHFSDIKFANKKVVSDREIVSRIRRLAEAAWPYSLNSTDFHQLTDGLFVND